MVLTLRRVLGYISPRWRDASTCEACGGPFTCGASAGGCWCAEVKVSEAVRANLKTRYKRCLCRTCLERAGTGTTGTTGTLST